MRLLLLGALVAVGACADTYTEDRLRITRAVNDLTGSPVSAAIERFGVPTSTSPAGDATIYLWRTDNVFASDSTRLSCEVKMLVDASERIVRGDLQGNNLACQRIAQTMR